MLASSSALTAGEYSRAVEPCGGVRAAKDDATNLRGCGAAAIVREGEGLGAEHTARMRAVEAGGPELALVAPGWLMTQVAPVRDASERRRDLRFEGRRYLWERMRNRHALHPCQAADRVQHQVVGAAAAARPDGGGHTVREPSRTVDVRPKRSGGCLLVEVQEAAAVDVHGAVPAGAGHQAQAEASAGAWHAMGCNGRLEEHRQRGNKHQREEGESVCVKLHGCSNTVTVAS